MDMFRDCRTCGKLGICANVCRDFSGCDEWIPMKSKDRPQLGCSPYYVNISARICELCEAIKRYSTESDKHDKISLWCREIMYLNEVDRNLRYDEKCKVWREDKKGHLHEMP